MKVYISGKITDNANYKADFSAANPLPDFTGGSGSI